jgi:UDP-N-acetylmuramoyl-L-alanyl-D-glutamate--2,6-diaminopimelate ligase
LNKSANISGEVLTCDIFNSTFLVTIDSVPSTVRLGFGGPFIIENALAAIAVAHSLNIPLTTSVQALKETTAPAGRFEVLSTEPFVLINYAHTIAAVEKLLQFLKNNWSGNIIHVFGAAGGGRDTWKRPKLAELSEKYTDLSILTEENSFDESIDTILSTVNTGFKNKNRVLIIANRKDALKKAIELANGNSRTLLLFTGKGCETVMAGPYARKYPYNEKETVLCLLDNH